MNDLTNMLREAFEAGMACAAAYEHGTYTVDFKRWHEENKKEIEQLHKLLMLSDGHKGYRKNDDEDSNIHSNHSNRCGGLRGLNLFVAIPIHELPKKAGWYNVIGDCNPYACGRMWFDGNEFNVPTNYMNITLYWLSETEIA